MYRILYVDDEPSLLDIGKLFLEESGDFTVTTKLSATEGILLLEQEKFDAIVSDYQMPVMDGIQFLVEVRSRFGPIPFILFTGRGREEVVIQAINSGADFYLQKGGEPNSQFAELSHKILIAVEYYRSGEKIQSLNRLYSVLSATNKAIIGIHTKSDFFSEICRILVGIGGFRMAWIGLADKEQRVIKPVASSGYTSGYLDTINISTEDVPHGRGPTGTAYREGKYYISNDIASDPRMEPWRENALKRGYLANAAFPFALGTKNAGVISLYAQGTGFFDEHILTLLEELADDVSFALITIDDRNERKQAEGALKESEEKFHSIYQNMTDGAALHQLTFNDQGIPVDYVIIETNSAFERLLGISREIVLGKTSKKAYGVTEPPYLEIYARVAQTGEPVSFETYFPPLEKYFSISVYCPKKGRFATIFKDITERKRIEEELLKKNEELRASFEQIAATEEELRGNLDELARQELKLRENEANLRAILDATPFPVALVDLQDNNIHYWSRSALTLFGHTAPTTDAWYTLAYPDPGYRQDVIDRWKPYLEKAKRSGQPVNTGDYRVTCRDGSVRICELYATFLADKLIVTFNDITERKRAEDALLKNAEELQTAYEELTASEEELRQNIDDLGRNERVLLESEDRFRGIFDTVTSGVAIYEVRNNGASGKDYIIKDFNKMALEIEGKKKEEVVGKSLFDLRPAIDDYGLIPVFQQVWKTGVPAHFPQKIYIDEKYSRWYENRVFRLQSGEIVAVYDDITERKQAELERESALLSLKEAQKIAQLGKWELDRVNNTLRWSDGIYEMFEINPAQFMATYEAFLDCIHPDDRDKVNSAYAGSLKNGQPYEISHRLRMVDGRIKWVKEICHTDYDSQGQPLRSVGIVQDISDIKKAEEALILANRKLNLLYSITRHDINNQITVLQGYLVILKKKQPDSSFAEYFLKINAAAERISAMIRFTKEYENIGVNAPVWQGCDTLIETAMNQIPLGRVRVINEIPATTKIFADPLIVKVCYNLMENAVLYGGKITIIRFSVEERDGDHIVVCEDNGDGVPHDEKELIFTKGYGKNTGMGLFISREILDITGITIRETGEPGKGARFEITVPKGIYRLNPPIRNGTVDKQ